MAKLAKRNPKPKTYARPERPPKRTDSADQSPGTMMSPRETNTNEVERVIHTVRNEPMRREARPPKKSVVPRDRAAERPKITESMS
jgi:hypothetical protein